MVDWIPYDPNQPPAPRTFALWFIPKRRRTPFVLGHVLGTWVREETGSAVCITEPGIWYCEVNRPTFPALDDAIEIETVTPLSLDWDGLGAA